MYVNMRMMPRDTQILNNIPRLVYILAIRFGITESTAKTTTAVSGDKPGSTTKEPSTEELEKLKKRAERFGAVVSTKLTKVWF